MIDNGYTGYVTHKFNLTQYVAGKTPSRHQLPAVAMTLGVFTIDVLTPDLNLRVTTQSFIQPIP